jgi:dTDP-4-dehydrorhamnose 3,5-epimerase
MAATSINERLIFLDGSIDGVIVSSLELCADARGWLAEFYREDELPPDCQPAMAYVSQTLPGMARGPHEHAQQTDLLGFFGPGEFTLWLWDARADSRTCGRRMKMTVGPGNPVRVTVPPGVVHGYKNTGDVPGWVFNAPSRLYAGWGKRSAVDETRHEDRPDSPYVMV